MVFVGYLSCLFELGIGLIQQFLRLRGVAAKVEFVGLLGVGDALVSLIDQALRGGQIRMAFGADVTHRLLSCGGGDGGKTHYGNECNALHAFPFDVCKAGWWGESNSTP